MTDEGIKKLKDKIDDGAAMAHDPMCSEGFEAARMLIEYYEIQLERCMRIVTIYEDLLVVSNKIAEARKK